MRFSVVWRRFRLASWGKSLGGYYWDPVSTSGTQLLWSGWGRNRDQGARGYSANNNACYRSDVGESRLGSNLGNLPILLFPMKADEVHSDSDDMIGWPHFSLIKPLLDSGQDNNTARYSETRACQAKGWSEMMVIWKLQLTIR